MKRKGFFKALVGLIAAPSIIKDINWAVPKVQSTGILFSDLNLIVPTYYADLIKKYGNDSYLTARETLGKPMTWEEVSSLDQTPFGVFYKPIKK